MKILFTVLAVVLCGINGFSQFKVPDVVKAKVASLYPNAGNTKWEMEDGLYEASFKQNKLETAVLLSRDGSLIQTETEMDVNRIPQTIKDYVSSRLGGMKIASATQIVSANGAIKYEADVNNTDYIFDANGQYLSMEENEEPGEDD